jgi:hypothetical protein
MTTDAGQVTDGDITIDSNHETAEQISAAFETDDTPVANAAPAESAAPVEKRQNRRESATEAVSSAVGKQRAAERRAEAAEARIAELSRQPEPEPAPVSAPGSEWARFKAMPGVPTVDQFDAYEDYSMAMATFVSDVRDEERQTQRQERDEQSRVQRYQTSLDTAWTDRLTAARDKNPNLDAELNPDTPMSLPMQHLVKDSPLGIELLQWLSAHPDESQRLSTLHPADTYREMGKLEGRLEAASSPRGPARVVSSAKAPIKPLGTSPPVSDPFEISDDLSMDEHFRRMNAADRQAGRL